MGAEGHPMYQRWFPQSQPAMARLWSASGFYDTIDAVGSGNLTARMRNGVRRRTGRPRLLHLHSSRSGGATPWSPRRLNALVQGIGARSYLEIGVDEGRTFENIVCPERCGVDPSPKFDTSRLPEGATFFLATSDEFFGGLGSERAFDVVFIDGLHTFDQAYRDLLNALARARPRVVMIDDTVPQDQVAAIPDQAASLKRRLELGLSGWYWQGDVWKVVVCISRIIPNFNTAHLWDLGTRKPFCGPLVHATLFPPKNCGGLKP